MLGNVDRCSRGQLDAGVDLWFRDVLLDLRFGQCSLKRVGRDGADSLNGRFANSAGVRLVGTAKDLVVEAERRKEVGTDDVLTHIGFEEVGGEAGIAELHGEEVRPRTLIVVLLAASSLITAAVRDTREKNFRGKLEMSVPVSARNSLLGLRSLMNSRDDLACV